MALDELEDEEYIVFVIWKRGAARRELSYVIAISDRPLILQGFEAAVCSGDGTDKPTW